jgi:hypothetical protein
MRHKLIFCLAVCCLVLAPLGVVEAADLKVGGEFRVRFFGANNLTDAHHSDGDCPDGSCDDAEVFKDARFRLKVSLTAGVASGVVITDFFNETEGAPVSSLADADTVETGNRRLGDGFGGSLDTVGLREAYVKLAWPHFIFVAGRQSVKLGNGILLEDVSDGWVAVIPYGPVNFTVGDLKLAESDEEGAAAEGDTDAYLANFTFSTAPLAGHLYTVFVQDRGPNLLLDTEPVLSNSPPVPLSNYGDDGMTLFAVGTAMDFLMKSATLTLEGDYLSGKVRTDDPTPLNGSGEGLRLRGADVLAGLVFRLDRLRIGLTGLYATGQKTDGSALNITDLSSNLKWGEILLNNEMSSDRDGGSPRGLSSGRLLLSMDFTPTMTGELAGIWAQLTEEPSPGAARELGWEADARLLIRLEEGMVWSNGVGVLFVGDGWQDLLGDPEATNNLAKVSSKLAFTF